MTPALLVFFIVGAVTIASALLVVSMRNPVHSALFLLLAFLCVAILFVIKGAEFVGAVQLLVYAGGIMVLFLFVVMLINVRHLPDERVLSSFWKGGLLVGVGLFVIFLTVVRTGTYHDAVENPKLLRSAVTMKHRRVTLANGQVVRRRVRKQELVGNSEAIGMSLYRDYLVPFEVASLFLLVAMVGAILIGKRELSATEEETNPQFILDRVEVEKEVKEAMRA